MKTGNTEIAAYLAALSSKAPVPGGGGASALAGAYGVSLGLMVGNLTSGKKKYADFEEKLRWIMEKLGKLQADFLRYADEDEEVFLPLSAAYGLPEGSAEEKAEKAKTLEACLLQASLTPLKVMEKACEALKYMQELAEKGSRLAVSDVGVGVQFLQTALLGAVMNVYINTKLMQDREKAAELNGMAARYVEDGTHLAYQIYADVEQALRP